MSTVIPTYSDPFYEVVTSLDGTPYRFEFRYNQREDRWHFSLGTVGSEWLIVGVKVAIGADLLRGLTHPLRPAGILIATSSSSPPRDPGLLDLIEGGDGALVYFPASEVPS